LPRHPSIKAGLAGAYAEAGETGKAWAILDDLGAASLTGIPLRVYHAVLSLALLVRACVALDDRGLASRLRDELLPYRDQMIVLEKFGVGPVAHYLGRLDALLGRTDEADEHFAFAAELQERTGARGLLAQTRLEWARLLLRRGGAGDGERAHRLAGGAAELADELDTPVLAERALELLATTPATG
jgi:hypothetical protein